MTTYKRLRIAGHKLVRENFGYAEGWCECGQWIFKGWTTRMSDVIHQHNIHLANLKEVSNERR